MLYTLIMNSIFDIFSSPAKAKILNVLYFQVQPIPLRHIAYISGLPVFSVQNAVRSLLDDELINKSEEDNYVLFELNKVNPFYDILRQFFIIEVNNRICMGAKTYYQKAKQVLEFANAAYIIFRCAKKKRKIK